MEFTSRFNFTWNATTSKITLRHFPFKYGSIYRICLDRIDLRSRHTWKIARDIVKRKYLALFFSFPYSQLFARKFYQVNIGTSVSRCHTHWNTSLDEQAESLLMQDVKMQKYKTGRKNGQKNWRKPFHCCFAEFLQTILFRIVASPKFVLHSYFFSQLNKSVYVFFPFATSCKQGDESLMN